MGHRSWGAFRGWGQYLAIALPALSMKCTGAPRDLCSALQRVSGLHVTVVTAAINFLMLWLDFRLPVDTTL